MGVLARGRCPQCLATTPTSEEQDRSVLHPAGGRLPGRATAQPSSCKGSSATQCPPPSNTSVGEVQSEDEEGPDRAFPPWPRPMPHGGGDGKDQERRDDSRPDRASPRQ